MVSTPHAGNRPADDPNGATQHQQPVIAAAHEPPTVAGSPGQRDVTSRMANEIVGLHKRLRGRGPDHVRVHLQDDLVTVVLRDDFSPLERALVREGRRDAVKDQRDAYEAMVAPELKTIVEAHTGRTVDAFLHAGHHEPDVYVELFILAPQ